MYHQSKLNFTHHLESLGQEYQQFSEPIKVTSIVNSAQSRASGGIASVINKNKD